MKSDLQANNGPGTRARRIGAAAVGLGLLADLVLREFPWGINATLWLGLLALAGFLVHRSPGRQGGFRSPFLIAALFAAGLAWRASPVLAALFCTGYVTAIALPHLRDPLAAGIFRYAMAFVATLVGAGVLALGAISDLARMRRPAQGRDRRRLAPLARGVFVAVPFLLVFGALFSAADPVFEWYVGDVFDLLLERLPSHVLVAGFFAWIACGILYGLALPLRLRARVPGSEEAPVPGRGRGTEAMVALLLVDALFLAFLLVQLRILFGGHEFVETTLGLSYATYARQGFFQLVAAATIALPGLLAADWAVPKTSNGRSAFRFAATSLLLMVAAVLVSAALRMRLYVWAYGLTELRLYSSAFMVWLLLVFVWFGATVLTGRRKRFMAGALGAWLAGILLLGAIDPDATIVRVNAARAESSGAGTPVVESRFDARYASSLSADAVPALLAEYERLDPWQRCVVAERLLGEGADTPSDWRTWNRARQRARQAVLDRRPDLHQAFRSCRVVLDAPSVVVRSAAVRIGWTGFAAREDHISIARPGAPDDEYLLLTPTWRPPAVLDAPAVSGAYELRYHLGESRRVVARRSLLVR